MIGVDSQKSLLGRRVVITGGTGSFGNRVAQALVEQGADVCIFSRDEKKQSDMAQRFPDLSYVLGDVRDVEALTRVLRGADHVFHAAALKQVPSCEFFPWEAIKTNTIGSHNVCQAAIAAGVRSVVALSTDKAVKPVNAMGMSKALMEKVVCTQNIAPVATVFSAVRYGNVMGSRGSVIPLFRRHLASGKALTLTVPGMTRFMMTLDESVDLVLHALTAAQGGEIFVRKAPACTIEDLAKAMCAMYSPLGVEHPVSVTGVRPGEKLHEVLVNEYEMQRSHEDATFFCIPPEYRDSAVSENSPRPPMGTEYTSENTTRLTTTDEIRGLLSKIGEVEFWT